MIVSSSRFCWNPPKSLNRWRPSASCGPDRPFGHSWWICFTQWMLYTTPCWFCPTGLGAWALWIGTSTMCPCMCLWCFFGSSLTPAFFLWCFMLPNATERYIPPISEDLLRFGQFHPYALLDGVRDGLPALGMADSCVSRTFSKLDVLRFWSSCSAHCRTNARSYDFLRIVYRSIVVAHTHTLCIGAKRGLSCFGGAEECIDQNH